MAHSQARELVKQGYTATLVSDTLKISRSSLYYRKRPHRNRADRSYDEQIVVACGEKTSYGYRRIAWWMQREKQLRVNGKRVLRVMRERGLSDSPTPAAGTTEERMGPRRGRCTESDLAIGHDEGVGRSKRWVGLPGGGDRLLHTRDRGLGLVAPLPNGRSIGGGRTSGAEPLACGKPRCELDADHRQRHAIHFDALHADAIAAGHHAPPNGISSPGRQQLHRTVPSQLEGGGSLGA